MGGQFQLDDMRVLWALRGDGTGGGQHCDDGTLLAAIGKAMQHKVIVARGSSGYVGAGERRRSSITGSNLFYTFSRLARLASTSTRARSENEFVCLQTL